MEEVWNRLHTAKSSEELSDAARKAAHDNLLEFESKLNAEPQPLQVLRCELMDSLDRQVLNTEILNLPAESRARLREQNGEILQDDSEARQYLAANGLRMAVLREYAGLRFGDRAEGDWFDVYAKATHLRQRGTRQFIERTLGGIQNATDDARFQSMTLVDREIRARLLQVPAGTRFPGFGETDGAAA
ncbi:MAG: hypothetical protein WCC11_03910 [Gammaproteobacteria bacterium]